MTNWEKVWPEFDAWLAANPKASDKERADELLRLVRANQIDGLTN